jgi:KDO2-lipid IV(A) lauroyltransferase
MWRYRAFRLAAWMAETFPRIPAYGIAWLVAEISYLFNGQGRRAAVANMRHVLGPSASRAAVRRAARGCFRAAAFYYIDLARTPLMRPHRFFACNVRVRGLEHLLSASRSGKGCIAVSIHYGNPEYTAQCLSAVGLRFMALVEPLEPPALSAMFARYRHSQGHEFATADMRGVRRAIRHLRRGGTLAVLIDRDIQHTGILVPFLGAPARIPTGAVELALATGALVVPFITRRIGLDRFEAVIEPPITLQRSSDHEADRRRYTEQLLRVFEPYLRRDPGQWFVLEEPVWPAPARQCRQDRGPAGPI